MYVLIYIYQKKTVKGHKSSDIVCIYSYVYTQTRRPGATRAALDGLSLFSHRYCKFCLIDNTQDKVAQKPQELNDIDMICIYSYIYTRKRRSRATRAAWDASSLGLLPPPPLSPLFSPPPPASGGTKRKANRMAYFLFKL